MKETLLQFSQDPLLLALGLIIVSWIWEDAAVVASALLAADQILAVPLAIVAVFVGICSGDIGLYYIGRLATLWRPLRRRILLNPKSRRLRRRFKQRTLSNILFIRFLPGLRTIGFTLCGLWEVTFVRFVTAMAIAGALWIAIVFTLVYRLGSSHWLAYSPWKWSLIAVVAVLFVINNVWSRRVR